jgi:ribosomal protein S18 acetylase RimI-like enzyme
MLETITIHPVKRTELPIIIEMGRSTFIENYAHLNDPDNFYPYLEEAFHPDQWLLEWLDPLGQFFLAWQNDLPIGYIKVNLYRGKKGLEGDQQAELERIYVVSTAQKSGVGRKLLDQAIASAKNIKAQYLWLGVWQNNPKAIEWYKRQGFEQLENTRLSSA